MIKYMRAEYASIEHYITQRGSHTFSSFVPRICNITVSYKQDQSYSVP